MLKSCKHCGSIHQRNYQCPSKPVRVKQATHIDKFRWSKAWQRKRATIRDRDKHLCQLCMRRVPKRYTFDNIEVHHIIPIYEDWDRRLDEDNLICLCASCHKQAELRQVSRELLFDIVNKNSWQVAVDWCRNMPPYLILSNFKISEHHVSTSAHNFFPDQLLKGSEVNANTT